MSTSTNPNFTQRRGPCPTPTPTQPTSSHASAGTMHSSGPVSAAASRSVNPQLPTPPVPANAFQKAIQKCVAELSLDDKTAFLSAPCVLERLREVQCNDKSLISSSRLARAEKVLQCVKHFMGSLAIFIQHSPVISSLVVGGVNCLLTVCTSSTFLLSKC